ncbi:unnamed protein product [Urochloa humidicola]
MQKRALAVCVAAALLGLVAAALGFAAEYFKHKAFVGRTDALRCEYRRTPALGCGVLAAALSLAALALTTAASGCFLRCGAAAPAAEKGRTSARNVLATLAWLLVLAAVVMFLYGASRNAGGTGSSFTATSSRDSDGDLEFVCSELRDGLFVAASINAAVGIACAIAAYVDIVRHRDDRTVTLGVAMGGQPAYPAAPVAYPAQPPYGGYGYGGAKQPGGTA